MSDRLVLRGALAEKKEKRFRLAAKAAGIISALRRMVLPAAVTPLADLPTAEIMALAVDLDSVRDAYMELSAEMADIERELGS